jgi:hypothetical protein
LTRFLRKENNVVHHTHTYAILEVSIGTFEEIETKLRQAGYAHAFDDGLIDMNGIALEKEELPVDVPPPAGKTPGWVA